MPSLTERFGSDRLDVVAGGADNDSGTVTADMCLDSWHFGLVVNNTGISGKLGFCFLVKLCGDFMDLVFAAAPLAFEAYLAATPDHLQFFVTASTYHAGLPISCSRVKIAFNGYPRAASVSAPPS